MKGEKKEGGKRWRSKRRGARKRKCFVCFVWMNASMHRHACLRCVNTHALVESEPGAKQIDRDDKQIDRIIYFPITPRPASVLQSLSLSCSRCQWWKKQTAAWTVDFLVTDGQADRKTEPEWPNVPTDWENPEVWLKISDTSHWMKSGWIWGVLVSSRLPYRYL